ncbi:MAG: hypothetical protein IOC86_03670 [Aestuariivirga sp.]|nr:hypothetical protein [Aestuariivirga sp.]
MAADFRQPLMNYWTIKFVLFMFRATVWSTSMANVTFFVMIPFKKMKGAISAQAGVQCQSERSAMSQARNAVTKGAIGAIAFKRSGDPGLGEYGEAVLICKEGELPDDVMEMLAA